MFLFCFRVCAWTTRSHIVVAWSMYNPNRSKSTTAFLHQKSTYRRRNVVQAPTIDENYKNKKRSMGVPNFNFVEKVESSRAGRRCKMRFLIFLNRPKCFEIVGRIFGRSRPPTARFPPYEECSS